MSVDQNYLNHYFGNIWHTNSNPVAKFEKSGLALVNKIAADETVLDVGCGTNPFKKLIPNLTGIDPAFEQADHRCTIEDFETDQRFDVAFCLGSINFGTREDVVPQIAKVISLLKPGGRIYWRCNPGEQDHPDDACKKIIFYPWSIIEHVKLSNMFNAKLVECSWEPTGNRLYAEWRLA